MYKLFLSKFQFILVDMKGKLNTSGFDAFRNKAKKKLTNSFETLLTKAHHNIEDVKEAFRHSISGDSEGGLKVKWRK